MTGNDVMARGRTARRGLRLAATVLVVAAVVALVGTTVPAGAADQTVAAEGAPVSNSYRCSLFDAPFTTIDTTIATSGDATPSARFGETVEVSGVTITVGANLTGVPAPGVPAPTVTNIWPSVNAQGGMSYALSVGQFPDTVVAPGGGFTTGPVHGPATMGPWGESMDFVLGGVSFTITTSTASGPAVSRWNCLGLQPAVPFAVTTRVDPVHDALVLVEADLLARAASLPPGPAALAGAAATLVGDGPAGARRSLEYNDPSEAARRIFLAQLLVHLAIGQGATSLAPDEHVLVTANLALGGDTIRLAQLRSSCPGFSPYCPAIIERLGTYVVQLDAGRAARDRGDLVVAGWTAAITVDQASRVSPPF